MFLHSDKNRLLHYSSAIATLVLNQFMEDVKAEYSDRISHRAIKCFRKGRVPERFKTLTINVKMLAN